MPTLVVGGQVGAQVGSDSRLVDRLRTRRNARLAEDAELGMQEGDLATGRSLSNVFDWLSDIWGKYERGEKKKKKTADDDCTRPLSPPQTPLPQTTSVTRSSGLGATF